MKTLRAILFFVASCLVNGQTCNPQGATSTICYYGQGVLSSFTIYPIFYGDVSADTQALLNDFMKNLPYTGLWSVVQGYTDASGNPAGWNVSLASSRWIADRNGLQGAFVYGTTLSQVSVQQIIQDQINASPGLPASSTAIYAVIGHGLTNSESYHSSFSVGFPQYAATLFSGYTQLHFVFIPLQSLTGTTPNGNPSADLGASFLLHELAETATDPSIPTCCGWTGTYGGGADTTREIADLCQTYTTGLSAPNGGPYTVQMSSQYATSGDPYSAGYSGYRDWNVQPLWTNTTGNHCNWTNW